MISFLTFFMTNRGRDSRGLATAIFGTPSIVAETAVVLLSGRNMGMRLCNSSAGAFKTESIFSSKSLIISRDACGGSTSSPTSVSFLLKLTDRIKRVSSVEHFLSSSGRSILAATSKTSGLGRKRVTGVEGEDEVRFKGTTDEVATGEGDIKPLVIPREGEASRAIPKRNVCNMLWPPRLPEQDILTVPPCGDLTKWVSKT